MTEPIVYRLDAEDVIRSDENNLPFIEVQTCLTSDILENLKEAYDEDLEKAAFTDGVPCRILSPGQKRWLSGKLRLVLEVELDSDQEDMDISQIPLDSPLDELRKLANE